ncbi:hypothetical protein BDR26DRAFT_861334 [Obelidium mucronatum]|nr:hypothetical protein BDR26DRAFT_861334 [Obelidium mucronatum]
MKELYAKKDYLVAGLYSGHLNVIASIATIPDAMKTIGTSTLNETSSISTAITSSIESVVDVEPTPSEISSSLLDVCSSPSGASTSTTIVAPVQRKRGRPVGYKVDQMPKNNEPIQFQCDFPGCGAFLVNPKELASHRSTYHKLTAEIVFPGDSTKTILERDSDGYFHCRCGAKYSPMASIVGHARKCSKAAGSQTPVPVVEDGGTLAEKDLMDVDNAWLLVVHSSSYARKKPFKFSMPMYYGETLLNTEEDFCLPYDLFRFVKVVGAGEMAPLPQLSAIGKRKPEQFVRIRKNIFVDRKPRKAAETPICGCKAPEDGSPACGKGCLNRMMQFECTDGKCPAGAACSNQSFQACGTLGRGFGIRTTVLHPKNTFLMEYCGEIISQETCIERMNTIYSHTEHYYFLNYDKSEVIDGCRKGSDARFVNHSCAPNCRIEKWSVNGEYHVGLFADQDIQAGMELTYDYKFESFGPMKKCRCGAIKCRGFLGINKNETRSEIKALKLSTLTTLDPALLDRDAEEINLKEPFSFIRRPLCPKPSSQYLPFVVQVLTEDGTPFDTGVNISYFNNITPRDTLLTLYRDAWDQVNSTGGKHGEGGERGLPFLSRNLRSLYHPCMTEEDPLGPIITGPVFLKRNRRVFGSGSDPGIAGIERRGGGLNWSRSKKRTRRVVVAGDKNIWDILYKASCERAQMMEVKRRGVLERRREGMHGVLKMLLEKRKGQGSVGDGRCGSGAGGVGLSEDEEMVDVDDVLGDVVSPPENTSEGIDKRVDLKRGGSLKRGDSTRRMSGRRGGKENGGTDITMGGLV